MNLASILALAVSQAHAAARDITRDARAQAAHVAASDWAAADSVAQGRAWSAGALAAWTETARVTAQAIHAAESAARTAALARALGITRP
jgi:hypothetical protein